MSASAIGSAREAGGLSRPAVGFLNRGAAAVMAVALAITSGCATLSGSAYAQGSDPVGEEGGSFIDLESEEAAKLREAAIELEPDLLAVILVPAETISETVVAPAAGYEQLPPGRPVTIVESLSVTMSSSATILFEGSKCKVKIVDGSPTLLVKTEEEKERCLCKVFDIGC